MFKARAQYFLPHLLWCLGFTLVTFDQVATFKVSGFTVKIYYFFFAAAALLFTLSPSYEKPLLKILEGIWAIIARSPLLWFFLLLVYYTAMSPFSVLPKKSIAYSLLGWFQLFTTAGTGFLIWKEAVKRGDAWKLWLWCIGISMIVLSLITITDYFAFFHGFRDGLIGFNQDTNTHINVSRPHAFAYEPSYLALYLSLCTAFLYTDLILEGAGNRKLPTIFTSTAIALTIAALFLCSSRSGWVVFAFYISSLTLWHYLKEKTIPKAFRYFVVLAIALVLGLFLLSPQKQLDGLKERFITPFLTMEDGPTKARVKSMLHGVEIAQDTHYTGTGLGASYFYWINKWDPGYADIGLPKFEQGAEVVMSLWAQVFAEAGIPGLLLYFIFAVQMIRALHQRVRRKSNPQARTAFITGCVFFVFISHGLGNHVRTDVWVWYLIWIFIALGDTQPRVPSQA